jgi:hypothetical protein
MIQNALKKIQQELRENVAKNFEFHKGYFHDMGNYRLFDLDNFEFVRDETERLKKQLYTLIFIEEEMNFEEWEHIPEILDFLDDYHNAYFFTFSRSMEQFEPAFKI